MQRSAIFLSAYQYTIEYKINVNVVNPMHANTDFLSRLILPIHENKDLEDLSTVFQVSFVELSRVDPG